MAKKEIKQSETITINRSQINLNPYNPKRHSEKKVTEQKKNILKVGFLGGVTWNRRSGNLIDGHRRIKAMDLHYGYDGTAATDYAVKVEAVGLGEKQEKEQMTYMALGNTKADYQLIAEYLPDIDYTAAGIDEYDLAQITAFLPTPTAAEVESYDDLISQPDEPVIDVGNPTTDYAPDDVSAPAAEPTAEEKKAAVKAAKQAAQDKAFESFQNLNAYITISFADAEQKRMFCELARIAEDEMFMRGDKILELIQ